MMTEKQENICKAIEAINNGTTISAAARQYNVPKSTLHDKVRGRSSVECSMGPPTVLSKDEEEHLKSWIIFMAQRGFPVTKAQLLDSVSLLMKRMKRHNPFTNDRPGRHWFEAFIKRHPEVGQRVAQNLTQTRALVNEIDLRTWFKEIEEFFAIANLKEAAQDPRRVFNCDESAFFLSPTDNTVLAKRGSKNVYNVIPSNEKECVTVLISANAAGELAPPMVLFKLKSIPHAISKNTPSNWGLGHTPKGWMTGESFYEYMANVFFPWLEKSNIQMPIIFYLDGHCSHTTLPLSNFCREKNIQLIALYPNATHLIQPMDVAVFRPLKRIWKKTVYEWRNEHQFTKLKKPDFCPLLNKALKQLDPDTIKNGFRKSGLSPFDANSVDYSKCVTNDPHKFDTTKIQSDTVGHFKYFESQISSENLETFYKNKGPAWKGDKSLEGLFHIWWQMKDQIKMPSDSSASNNGSSSTTQLEIAQDTSDINKSSSFLDIGNFTGLTDVLNTSFLNSNELMDVTENTIHEEDETERNKENVSRMELYDFVDGTLTKIMDIQRETKKSPPYLSGQIIRTIGSQPIYLTPLKNITSNIPAATTAPLPNASEFGRDSVITTPSLVDTFIQPSVSSYVESTNDSIHIIQARTLKKPDHVTPSGNTASITPNKIKATSIIIADDTTPEHAQFKQTTSENKESSQPTLITHAFSDDVNRERPKKYYGQLVVPTPFKDALFWPETPSSSNTKSKIKLPSVITSDRWQIFTKKKIDAKIKKETDKTIAKEKKIKIKKEKVKKSVLGGGNKKPKKSLINAGTSDNSNEDWFCRLCQASTQQDMIQCVRCKVWYHTICAEVLPNEVTFHCIYCNVLFDE